jgi:superfamily II DNA or RNA helicase
MARVTDEPLDVHAPPARRVGGLLRALDEFDARTRARGRQYADGGRVGALAIGPTTVSATVRGTIAYEVVWRVADDYWASSCSCPVGVDCKHAYAVASRLLAQWERPGPASVVRSPVRSGALRRLRDEPSLWVRQQALAELLGDEGVYAHGLYGMVQDILAEPDPDLRCWRLVQMLAGRPGLRLPAALEPYRDRSDLAAVMAQRARVDLARDLVAWARQPRRDGQRSVRVVASLVQRPTRSLAVRLEVRVTTPRLADVPRTTQQLQQLRGELRRNPGLMPPEQAALLAWFADHQIGGTEQDYGLPATTTRLALEAISGSPLATWDTDLPAELAARGGIVPGGPVVLSRDPVRVLPQCVTRDGQTWIELHAVHADGRSVRLDSVLHLHDADDWAGVQTSLVLAAGAFAIVVAEPPSHVLERFRIAGALPVSAAERAPLVRTLASAFPHLRDTLAAHTRFHAVSTAVALDLRDDDWLQVRLFAYTAGADWRPGQPIPPDVVVFEDTPDSGWTRIGDDRGVKTEWDTIVVATAPPPVTGAPAAPDADDVWHEAPDPAGSDPVTAWRASVPATSGTSRQQGYAVRWPDRAVGWWMRANRRRMEALGEAWERRPPGVAFYGTGRVRRLLGGLDRVVPRLRVEASGLDWFAVSAEWKAEGLTLSDDDLKALRAATTRFVKLPSGWIRRDTATLHDETAEVLGDLGIAPGDGEQRVTVWQLAGARPESLATLAQLGADPATLRAVAKLREKVAGFAGLPRIRKPPGLTATLRPYQRDGLDFLVHASTLGIGAVLADDMGLGKTVQALAWLAHLRAEDPRGGPSLVVCPASVVHNWAREAARFTPDLRVLVLERGHGRHALRRQVGACDLVITNYALLRRDVDAWKEVPLRAAILDEAQNVKNPDAAVTRAALALRAAHRLALTGTPLENRALDLWSIVSFVNPGYLGSRAKFAARFDRPDAPPHTRTLLAAKLRPMLLRRLKREVATDLPDRIEERRDCELTAGQRKLYLAELRRSRGLIEQLSEAPGGLRQHRIDVLAALMRLRQVCCHPALAGGNASLGSGKFDTLFELLEPILAEGHKVLVFSQFVECLKLLAAELRARAIPQHMLTGSTTKRDAVVAAFADDPEACVFLVSLKAGGTGLNLTAASYVVLFDPWWNPAVEAQAIDRTHRIGQDRTVIAYRLLTRGTIEEKIWELQQRKATLVRDVLGEGGFGRALTRTDLDYLLASDEE